MCCFPCLWFIESSGSWCLTGVLSIVARNISSFIKMRHVYVFYAIAFRTIRWKFTSQVAETWKFPEISERLVHFIQPVHGCSRGNRLYQNMGVGSVLPPKSFLRDVLKLSFGFTTHQSLGSYPGQKNQRGKAMNKAEIGQIRYGPQRGVFACCLGLGVSRDTWRSWNFALRWALGCLTANFQCKKRHSH